MCVLASLCVFSHGPGARTPPISSSCTQIRGSRFTAGLDVKVLAHPAVVQTDRSHLLKPLEVLA